MGFDHRVGHFWPLRMTMEILKCLALQIVRRFDLMRRPQRVADAMIKAGWGVKKSTFHRITW